MTDFPRTFRHIDPDSNGAFRWYLTDLSMAYAHRHPNEEGYFPGLAKEWALDPENRTVYVRLDPEELRRITLWLDCNSNFYGAYHDTRAQGEGRKVTPAIR